MGQRRGAKRPRVSRRCRIAEICCAVALIGLVWYMLQPMLGRPQSSCGSSVWPRDGFEQIEEALWMFGRALDSSTAVGERVGYGRARHRGGRSAKQPCAAATLAGRCGVRGEPVFAYHLRKMITESRSAEQRASAITALSRLSRRSLPAEIEATESAVKSALAAARVRSRLRGRTERGKAAFVAEFVSASRDDPVALCEAIRLASELPAADSIPILREFRTLEQIEVKRTLARELGFCRGKEAVAPLLELACSNDPIVRGYAVKSLGMVGTPDDLSALKKIEKGFTLDDMRQFVSQAAARDDATHASVSVELSESRLKGLKQGYEAMLRSFLLRAELRIRFRALPESERPNYLLDQMLKGGARRQETARDAARLAACAAPVEWAALLAERIEATRSSRAASTLDWLLGEVVRGNPSPELRPELCQVALRLMASEKWWVCTAGLTIVREGKIRGAYHEMGPLVDRWLTWTRPIDGQHPPESNAYRQAVRTIRQLRDPGAVMPLIRRYVHAAEENSHARELIKIELRVIGLEAVQQQLEEGGELLSPSEKELAEQLLKQLREE